MFYTYNVDISNAKEMFNFINNHFTYSTLNSWNGLRSIANNVKLHRLHLSGDWTRVCAMLFDGTDRCGLGTEIGDTIAEWEIAHPGYKCYFNGRSGGYLVLYNDGNNKSVVPDCIGDYDNYEDFKADARDNYGGVKYLMDELRETTQLIREFDKLCDDLRDIVDAYSKLDVAQAIMESIVDEFNEYYEDDLNVLNFSLLRIVDGKIDLNEIIKMRSLLDAFISMFKGYDNLILKSDENGNFWAEER